MKFNNSINNIEWKFALLTSANSFYSKKISGYKLYEHVILFMEVFGMGMFLPSFWVEMMKKFKIQKLSVIFWNTIPPFVMFDIKIKVCNIKLFVFKVWSYLWNFQILRSKTSSNGLHHTCFYLKSIIVL